MVDHEGFERLDNRVVVFADPVGANQGYPSGLIQALVEWRIDCFA